VCVLLYDADGAGLKASFRAADELLRAGLRVSLAALPPGEDPDTLARKGGGDAVRSVLDDAVDVLERKLQLLEQKGWFASVAGRRRALDRLVPTLRAARDAVTRDLYVSRTAEALGVTRASIEGELAMARQPRPARAAGAPAAPPPPRRPAGPDRDLLRVMVHQPEWRARVAEQLADRSVLPEPERQLFEVLAAAGATPASDLVGQVPGEAGGLLMELVGEPWGGLELDALVDGAINRLDSRRLVAELEEVRRAIPFAADSDKPELVRRADSLSRRIAKLNPGRWNVMQTGRSGAR
jgi:DNA primase